MVLVRLLGPVDVVDDDGTVRGSVSAIRRTLLSLLAIHAGRVLSPDWLLEHAWDDKVPGSGVRALRFHISQLRRELRPLDVIETCPGGYRLRVAADEVDIGIVESSAKAARNETDPSGAVRLCTAALASWRGEPFVDASPTPDLTDEAQRLDELRLALIELSYRRRFDAGEGAELVAGLVRLTSDHPLNEGLWHTLIAAQYRAGRQAEALRSYDAVCSTLADTLGIYPSAELQQLQLRVLQQDPKLSAAPGRQADDVTFMLWDVEAPAGLLIRQGQKGVATLGRVAELVVEVALRHNGQVSTSQGEGDSAVLLFTSVARAIAAAVEVNEQMSEQSWPGGEPVDVRCAVHVGGITSTPYGVFGLEVHRCAQLRALAGGGEVFLSHVAATSVDHELPPGSSVIDEGLIQLRGFTEPDRVWRLVHPVLRARDGLVLGAAAPFATLPEWRNSFVGRSTEMASVAARLGAGRVVTLVGPAGVGETRLAVAVASEAPVHVYFIDLTRAANDGDVEAVAAEALGADAAAPPLKGIEGVLRGSSTIVVLDNCEHVLDGSAALVGHLLSNCREISVLATSRAPLRVPGEHLVTIEPLATTLGGPATQLLIQRAQDLGRALPTTGVVVEDIRRLVELLDGVPLALELAAARMTAFSVGEVLSMLEHDLGGLMDARRRGTDRHRTVRAAIQWSMLLLSEDDRRLLCRLAVLPGSFRLRTAIAATDTEGDDGRSLVSAMPTLIEQSLLTAVHRTGPTRYRLLEMIRAVGQDSLPAGDRKAVLDGLLVHLSEELEAQDSRAEPEPGSEAEVALDGPLYSAAVEHALATDQIELGLRLVYSLFAVWHSQTQRSTLDRWMSDLVSRVNAPSRLRVMVQRRQAIIANEDFGDDDRSMRLLDAAEADALAIADRQLLSMVQVTRLTFDQSHGRLDGVEKGLRDAIGVLEEFGDEFVANALTALGDLYLFRGQFDAAEEVFERAARAAPNWYQDVVINQELAWCALLSGRVELAATRAATNVEMAERTENPDLIAHAIEVAAYAALARGESQVASGLFGQAADVGRVHELSMFPYCLVGLAIASVLTGDLVKARSCRDELRTRADTSADMAAQTSLACAFVDLAQGNADKAAASASEVLTASELLGQRYVQVLGLELLAASIAASNPTRARELLAVAVGQRAEIGARAWPLDPYRHVALSTLDGRTANVPTRQ